ncbi:MAG: KTSC domain-containing protein [Actinophytocola sp.]|uniref:KTSC domain-containing protein n=1 Tax=Actinophytocola sp. TaxID=1872138 RepID=UPI00132C3CDD|nr:KTSC domain-containing protein [Actinophytocola sp.]MPZ85589.1 KTSC domain-containing protein [Actinophytocola sp.]
MHRQPIESSVLAEVGYDQQRRLLEVKLVGGAVYQYLDVPAREFMALLAADSSGRHYNTKIKPNYEYRQVS